MAWDGGIVVYMTVYDSGSDSRMATIFFSSEDDGESVIAMEMTEVFAFVEKSSPRN